MIRIMILTATVFHTIDQKILIPIRKLPIIIIPNNEPTNSHWPNPLLNS